MLAGDVTLFFRCGDRISQQPFLRSHLAITRRYSNPPRTHATLWRRRGLQLVSLRMADTGGRDEALRARSKGTLAEQREKTSPPPIATARPDATTDPVRKASVVFTCGDGPDSASTTEKKAENGANATAKQMEMGEHRDSKPSMSNYLLKSLSEQGDGVGRGRGAMDRLLQKSKSVGGREVKFGSFRFVSGGPGSPTVKFVRVPEQQDASSIVGLMIATWELPPPRALISIPATCGNTESEPPLPASLLLRLERGIAEALRATNAWLVTGGLERSAGAIAAGRACQYAQEQNPGSSAVCIGCVPWNGLRVHADLDELPNGHVLRVRPTAASRDDDDDESPRSPPSMKRNTPRDFEASEDGEALTTPQPELAIEAENVDEARENSWDQHNDPCNELQRNHSHFVMVDGPNVIPLRRRVERYISDEDISSDAIQTPKMVLVVGGDLAVLRTVRNALNPKDVSTGTSVPVLVAAESGGAARDIFDYCSGWEGEDGEDSLDGIRARWARDSVDAEYVKYAPGLLAAIHEFGQDKGQNDSQQLAFYKPASTELLANDDLSLRVQEHLLNDCPNMYQEALLAVSWGEPVILKHQLENNGPAIFDSTRAVDNDSPATKNLLTVALMRGVVDVVRIVMAHFDQPRLVVPDDLFVTEFNRYPYNDTIHLWDATVGAGKGKQRKSRFSFLKVRNKSAIKKVVTSVAPEPEAGERNSKREFRSSKEHADAMHGWEHAGPILSRMIVGYDKHLKSRCRLLSSSTGTGYLNTAAGSSRLSPMWNDVMIWAVLSGQHDLAELLWEKSTMPLRSAIMAQQLCILLAGDDALSPDRAELIKKAVRYEELALQLLDSVHSPKDAEKILTLIPWSWEPSPSGSKGTPRRIFLWESSPLDVASGVDSSGLRRSMQITAHRHSQHVLDRYWSGDYPGSKARVAKRTSFFGILFQAIIFFVPGTIVEVQSGNLPSNLCASPQSRDAAGTGSLSKAARHAKVKHEVDPDWASTGALETLLSDENQNTFRDIWNDLHSFRFAHFFAIPKVKFVLHFASFFGFQVTLGFNMYRMMLNAREERHFDVGYMELANWFWTLTRFLGEGSDVPSFDAKGIRLYISDKFNVFDVSIFLCIFTIMILRLIGHGLMDYPVPGWQYNSTDPLAEIEFKDIIVASQKTLIIHIIPLNLYAMVQVVIAFRVLQYFRYWKSLGVLTIVFFDMFEVSAVPQDSNPAACC